VAWSPDGTSFAVRVGLPAAGDLLIVSLSDFAYGPTRGDAASHPEPVVVSGSAFAHPTFRRDGSLVVAQRRSDGRWIRHILDVGDLSRPVEGATEYVGTPLGQDHDPSGEWLLAPVDDTGSGVGSVHWFGPNGDAGVIDGEFRAASW
jgi:hypothetical protein